MDPTLLALSINLSSSLSLSLFLSLRRDYQKNFSLIIFFDIFIYIIFPLFFDEINAWSWNHRGICAKQGMNLKSYGVIYIYMYIYMDFCVNIIYLFIYLIWFPCRVLRPLDSRFVCFLSKTRRPISLTCFLSRALQASRDSSLFCLLNRTGMEKNNFIGIFDDDSFFVFFFTWFFWDWCVLCCVVGVVGVA